MPDSVSVYGHAPRQRAAEAGGPGLIGPLLWVGFAVGWLLACGAQPAERVTLDLTLLASGGDDRAYVARRDGTGGPRWVHSGNDPVGVLVRPSGAAELRFGLAPEASADRVEVVAESDRGSRRLVLEARGDGEWAADLSPFAGEPLRLRFRKRDASLLEWRRPRIEGRAEQAAPPVLAADARPPRPPINVLLYVVDTLRRDRLSAYGYERNTSPHLDELAARGTLFANAYAPSASTGPSLSALFASRHPSEFSAFLKPSGGVAVTLAEAFSAAGYATAAFQANFFLSKPLGFGRGFDLYHVTRERREGRWRPLRAEQLHARVVEWLDTRPVQPFFLFVQSMDVHEYQPPSPFRERFGRDGEPLRWLTDEEFMAILDGDESGIARLGDLYDASVACNDHEIGRLLDALRERGLHDRTAVLVTADHGEPLGQRGHYMHGQSLHEEIVHVPLILYLPWQDGGRRVETVVSLLDVAPTLLGLAGVPVPVDFQGNNWLEARPAGGAPAVLGARVPLKFANRIEAPVAWYLRQGPWKLMMDSKRLRLFHLPSDPGEEHDVRRDHPVQAAYLASQLVRYSPAFQKGWRKPPSLEEVLTAEEREQVEEALQALGYAR